MSLPVVVPTNDHYYWCLPPFAYLFNTFWSALQPVLVGGFSQPPFSLPSNFTFYSIDHKNYPPGRWSTALIKLLEAINDDYIILLLEDYFLTRTVDHNGIATLAEYMTHYPEVVRMDLTTDRLYGMGMHDVEAYGHYDIIECQEDAPYQMSLQAAIWKRRHLLSLLVPNKSSWQVETETEMVGRGLRVLGTRQCPVKYINAVYKGEIDHGQLSLIPPPHKDVVLEMLPKNWRHDAVKNY